MRSSNFPYTLEETFMPKIGLNDLAFWENIG